MKNDNTTTKASATDLEKNKTMGILAYIIFFLPLLSAKDSPFAMYHANQGLLLLLTGIGVSVVGAAIPFLGWFIIGPLGSIFVLVLFVLGIINAVNGEMKPLPLIGKYTLIK